MCAVTGGLGLGSEGGPSDARSLVEEGEQVAHHHQRCSGDAQQDFADALRPLVHVLDSCSSSSEKKKSGFIFQLVKGDFFFFYAKNK